MTPAPASAEPRAPSALLALTELPRALVELGSLLLAAPLLATVPRGDGHPVLVIPGFVAGDASTAVLRHFLSHAGYDAHEWELGRNTGPKVIGAQGEKLVERLHAIHAATGRTVSLIGWSLGGIMARLVARRAPDAVRQVVTLGAPFAGNPRATNVWRLYELLAGQRLEDPYIVDLLAAEAAPPPVPSTAIWSRDDGIVAWQNCREPVTPTTDNIAVRGSHCGLGVNPAVLYAIADRLAQPQDAWLPFDPGARAAWMYPSAAVS